MAFNAAEMQGLTVLFCLALLKLQDEHDENVLIVQLLTGICELMLGQGRFCNIGTFHHKCGVLVHFLVSSHFSKGLACLLNLSSDHI